MHGNDERTARVLEAIQAQTPRKPIGLVTPENKRDTALAWLRDRRVDRILPEDAFDNEPAPHGEALASHALRLEILHRRLKARSPRTLLVTGATGFLGGHFLRYLLRCGEDRVIALSRSTRNKAFDDRLAHLHRLHPGRIACVEGDVLLPGLGLSTKDFEYVAEEVTDVWHLAAITRFEELLREKIFRVNLDGTRNVLDLARSLPRLERFHHVSTAYVAGNWPAGTVVPEGPLYVDHDFKNPYEASKYQAERLVAEAGLPFTVYRPSIILGESISGLSDGQTVYNVAKMLRMARMAGQRAQQDGPQTFRVVVDPGAAKNLISVDDVVCQMLHTAANETESAAYVNVAHPVPAPMTDLMEVIASVLEIEEYQAVSDLGNAPRSAAESVLERVSEVFRPYMLRCDASFETRATQRASGGCTVPEMTRARLHFLLRAFFEQHYNWNLGPRPVTV